jgi:hypothetical protein
VAALTGQAAHVRFSFDMRQSEVASLRELLRRVDSEGGGLLKREDERVRILNLTWLIQHALEIFSFLMHDA